MKKINVGEEDNKVFSSVWDELEDDPIKRENLRLCSKIMREINVQIDKNGFGQQQVTQILNVTQPRVSALRNGKINDFRIDTLVEFALRLGLHVSFESSPLQDKLEDIELSEIVRQRQGEQVIEVKIDNL